MRATLIALRKRYPALSDDKKRIPLFFLAIVGTVLLVNHLGSIVLVFAFGDDYNHPAPSRIVLPIILISTMTMAIYESIYYYVRLKKSIRHEEQAKQAIVQAQLDALRNQAQPHFFFNSLNTLRDIIDQNTKEDAKEFVNKLAEIYRFILESGHVNLTTLEAELKFARAYVHVQKERFGDNLLVEWNIPERMKNRLIVPMSLQLLLENAVKHNVISNTKPLTVTVGVVSDELIVANKMQPKSTQLPTTKLGLKNIDRRYALISEKRMTIEKDQGRFRVSLPLLNISDQIRPYAGIDY